MCQVNNPYPASIRITLMTIDACSYASELLGTPSSGWWLIKNEKRRVALEKSDGQ